MNKAVKTILNSLITAGIIAIVATLVDIKVRITRIETMLKVNGYAQAGGSHGMADKN